MKSFKTKIYILCAIWLALIPLMFLLLFTILDNSNAGLVQNFSEQQHDLAVLQAEQESFKQANSDLHKVTTEKYQPDDLFSKDVTFVNELKTLEALGQVSNIQLQITGISGTVKSVPKAPSTLSTLYQISYGLSLSGSLNNCLSFMEHLEHLPFATTISGMTIGASDGQVAISLNGYFYIKPQ